MTITRLFHLFISGIKLVLCHCCNCHRFSRPLFYHQEYIFIVNETVFEVKILYRQSLHVDRPKQLSVMQDFFVCFDFILMAKCSTLSEPVNIER